MTNNEYVCETHFWSFGNIVIKFLLIFYYSTRNDTIVRIREFRVYFQAYICVLILSKSNILFIFLLSKFSFEFRFVFSKIHIW
jgi:hypothetical protein